MPNMSSMKIFPMNLWPHLSVLRIRNSIATMVWISRPLCVRWRHESRMDASRREEVPSPCSLPSWCIWNPARHGSTRSSRCFWQSSWRNAIAKKRYWNFTTHITIPLIILFYEMFKFPLIGYNLDIISFNKMK